MTDIQKQQITAMRLQGAGYVTIGKMLGLSNNTVRSFCRRNGLDGDAGKNAVMCKQCSKPIKITPKRKPKIFCSDACRTAWWNSHPEEVNRKAIYRFICVCCGEPFTAYGNRNRKYCSRDCYFTDRFRKEQDFHE